MKIKFKFEKETKGTIRFMEDPADGEGTEIIGGLYVKKTGLRVMGWTGAEWPQTIEMDLQVDGEG